MIEPNTDPIYDTALDPITDPVTDTTTYPTFDPLLTDPTSASALDPPTNTSYDTIFFDPFPSGTIHLPHFVSHPHDPNLAPQPSGTRKLPLPIGLGGF